jgi:signal transduction histidine kinase
MSKCMSVGRPGSGLQRPCSSRASSGDDVIAPRAVAEFGPYAASSGSLADYEDRMHAVSSGLAAVSAAIQVLTATADGPGPEVEQRLAAMLVEELQRLQRLASFSDLSAPENQPVDEMDLDEVVRGVVLTRRLAHQDVTWHDSGYRILGRRDVVVELLHILLANAARHAPGATTKVEAQREGSMIRVSVTDSGPGVPEELRNVIFQRGGHREDSEGQGLGLSIARQLARGLGGTLELVPTAHAGARFDLTLPQGHLDGAA